MNNGYGAMQRRGTSTITGKKEIIQYIVKYTKKNALILDVGFGNGIYGRLLKEAGYTNIDGVDIYPKGIEEHGLNEVYNNIYITNIMDFTPKHYDLVILGDVLEHLTLKDSKILLNDLEWDGADHIIISVPYDFPHPVIGDNPYEKHLQPDINRQYMAIHFPEFKLIFEDWMEDISDSIIGVYVWRRPDD